MIDTLYKQEIKQTTEKKQMDKCRGSLQENLGLNKQIFQKTDDVKYKEIEQIQEGVPFCGWLASEWSEQDTIRGVQFELVWYMYIHIY